VAFKVFKRELVASRVGGMDKYSFDEFERVCLWVRFLVQTHK